MTVFIPLVNYLLLRYMRLAPHWADLWLSRGSFILTAFSFLVIAVAMHPVLLIIGLLIYNLGSGTSAAMRSVAIHVVGGQTSPDIGKLMSLIALTEGLGSMFAGPLLNETFKKGMDLGQSWLGLPFLGTGVMYALVTIITFIISFEDRDLEYVEVPRESDEEQRRGEQSTGLDNGELPSATIPGRYSEDPPSYSSAVSGSLPTTGNRSSMHQKRDNVQQS